MPLLLLVVVLPIVELLVIGEVRDVLGWGWTLLVLFGDGLLGAVLVRSQGRRTWRAFRDALAERRWPGDEVAQGALVLVGGALVVTPGFVTDTAGLLCLVPATRRIIAASIRRRMVPVMGFGGPRDRDGGAAGPAAPPLEAEVLSIDPDEPDSRPGPDASNG